MTQHHLLVILLIAGCHTRPAPLVYEPQPPPKPYVPDKPATLPAELVLDGARITPIGRLGMIIHHSDVIALSIGCPVPKPFEQGFSEPIGERFGASLALTRRAVMSIVPSPTAQPRADASEFEQALSGTITLVPVPGANEAIVTVKDLKFPSTVVKQFGPVRVQLDSPMPAMRAPIEPEYMALKKRPG